MSRSKLLLMLLAAGLLALLIPLTMALGHPGDTVTIRDSDDTNYSDKLGDSSTIQITGIAALPPNQVYEGWFVSDDGSRKESTGILVPDSSGNINQTFWLTAEPNTLVLSFTGVQALANGFHYEGWAIVDGSPVSTGKFNVDANGNLVDLNGALIANGQFVVTGTNLNNATAIVLTIEPAGDTDTVPSGTKYLGGDVSGVSANLAVSHGSSLGNDFLSATGSYILATPTDDPELNENSGIWFLDLSGGDPAQGLQLPSLPTGWIYEGWAVINGIPVSTGPFNDPAAADLAAPFSGPNPGPPFPGEGFLVNAPAGLTFPTDLAGATAVISIEPSPDDAAAPFTLKPLVGAIPVDATDHVTYSMGNQAAGFSTGTATISSGQPTGENLFADFDKFVVTIEPVTDPDPGPSADVALIHTIPAGGILHIRHLLFSLPSNPPYAVGFHTGTPKGITVGLREQAWAAWVHADLSVNSTNLADAILHACHVVNIIEGTGAGKGENFDANCGNPGDGFGVLSYAADTVLHAGLSATAAAGDQKLVDHSKEVIDSANQAWAWAKDARDVALTAKTSTDFLATQLLMRNVKSILGKTFNGFDADGDGAIERITGEGGTKQAYWAAQDMGEYLLTSPSDVAPPKTGDSNVPNVALAALLTGAFLLMTGVYVYRRSRRQT